MAFKVTPWEVSGKIDYNKLVERFGTQLIDENIRLRLKECMGSSHLMLRRNIFYSHRDLGWLLDLYDEGVRFFLYTGRGPSSNTHLGHLMPWMFTKSLQDAFDAKLYFQITDDEKFLFNQDLSLTDTKKLAYDNALDVVALGFDQRKTKILIDTEYIKTLYPIAINVAKHITFSTAKAVFGFTNSNNIGIIFFTSIQAAPSFIESELTGEDIPCLIPCAIDQDPHFRVCRDVAPSLGYYKPALIHCKMLPSLAGAEKMSGSIPETSIFTTDDPEDARRKIHNAFTGGAASIKEQREKGGKPEVCSVYQYYYFLFEEDNAKIEELYEKCRHGEILCGECKTRLSERIEKFLTGHQERREKAKDRLEDFMLRD
jgi:tryptophanyl-tRNA synthetase